MGGSGRAGQRRQRARRNPEFAPARGKGTVGARHRADLTYTREGGIFESQERTVSRIEILVWVKALAASDFRRTMDFRNGRDILFVRKK